MFWRDRERENKDLNGGPPCGQVRVLVVGDSDLRALKVSIHGIREKIGTLCHQSYRFIKYHKMKCYKMWSGSQTSLQSWLAKLIPIFGFVACSGLCVGKTSLVHLIVKGFSIARPSQTIGCTVGVKHITYGNSGSSSSSIKGDAERDFFVELWDVSGHDRYKDCRSLFYSQINGVIFVHDLSQRRTKTSLLKWASEISATGTFSVPLGSGGPGGIPVPYIVIGNKADVAAKEGTRGSSGNLVDAARQWVEKQGLLPTSDELPLTESFPGSGGLIAAAKEARFDKEAMIKFFRSLIRRRYFSEELTAPSPSPWSLSPVQRSIQRLDENSSDDDQFYKTTRAAGDPYNFNMLPPLPAQRNLTPPPTLYPQQPVSVTESYSFPRFPLTDHQEVNSTTRSKRMDINV